MNSNLDPVASMGAFFQRPIEGSKRLYTNLIIIVRYLVMKNMKKRERRSSYTHGTTTHGILPEHNERLKGRSNKRMELERRKINENPKLRTRNQGKTMTEEPEERCKNKK